MANITQMPMSKEALDRLLEDMGVVPDIADTVKEQHNLLVLIYEDLKNGGHDIGGKLFDRIEKQVNRWK